MTKINSPNSSLPVASLSMLRTPAFLDNAFPDKSELLKKILEQSISDYKILQTSDSTEAIIYIKNIDEQLFLKLVEIVHILERVYKGKDIMFINLNSPTDISHIKEFCKELFNTTFDCILFKYDPTVCSKIIENSSYLFREAFIVSVKKDNNDTSLCEIKLKVTNILTGSAINKIAGVLSEFKY